MKEAFRSGSVLASPDGPAGKPAVFVCRLTVLLPARIGDPDLQPLHLTMNVKSRDKESVLCRNAGPEAVSIQEEPRNAFWLKSAALDHA